MNASTKNARTVIAASAVAVAAAVAISWAIGRNSEPASTAVSMVSVKVPQLTSNERLGEELFNDNCSSCHGPNAAGREGSGPPLVHVIYEPNHHPDEAFQLAALGGVRQHHWPFGNMPPVDGIEREDVASIVAYVRALQRANGID